MSMLNLDQGMIVCMVPEDDFAQRIRPHLALLLQVARSIVGPADAEDATQEALIRAWQHITQASLPDVSSLRAWLVRITLNVCNNWQRGRFGTARRMNLSLTDATDNAAIGYIDVATDADRMDLRHAIDRLSPEYRQVIILRYYAGFDAAEIGIALDLPHGTVRSRLRRALQLLQADIAAIPPAKGAANA
jgi:RNA polymerase sigma-70 factor, ECF subfamily